MRININKLIYPYFVVSGVNEKQEIKSFPDVYRLSVDRILRELEGLNKLGIRNILLFAIPPKKDILGSQAYGRDNVIALAVKRIKREFTGLTVMTDVCLCAYTTHGHCGVLKNRKEGIDHARTVAALAKTALSHAEAGADYVAPSAMAKGQVAAIRSVLDRAGDNKTKIMGYSAKFASNFYGPFREAADSAPKFGDRRSYQLNFGNAQAALREIRQDISEGADIVMVKPALSYLDIIKQAKQNSRHPLAAYNVSGEYAMIKYGARLGLWDEKKMVFEVVTSIMRAGADFIITYHAKDIARWLKE